MDKKCHHLIIDKEFKALSPLYSKDILSKAETDILLSGSLSSPIKVWGNTILTDFLSYQICHKLNIPFEISIIAVVLFFGLFGVIWGIIEYRHNKRF